MLRIWDLNGRCAWRLVGWAVAGLLIACSAPAAAQSRMHAYGRQEPFLPLRLDGHLSASWEGGIGIGARADIPLVESSTLRYGTRDELALSIGGDVTVRTTDGEDRIDVYPTLALQWSLGVTERFAFVPELGFVTYIENKRWEGLYPNVGFGARYYLRRSFGLTARFGWPLALTAGVVF